MSYQLYTIPKADKALRKLPKRVRRHLVSKMEEVAQEPLAHAKLKAPWQFLRSCHTRYRGTDYRLVYQVKSKKQEIILFYAASRENFYRELHRQHPKPVK